MVIENVLAQLACAYSHAGNGTPLPAALRLGLDTRLPAPSRISQTSFAADGRNPNFATERR